MRMPAHTRKKPAPEPTRFWTVVVQLLDESYPRRHDDLPNVVVRMTVIKPGPALDRWWDKARQAIPDKYGEIRYDLMPKRGTTDQVIANRRHRETTARLRALGYTVNFDLTVWSVYVIELDSSQVPDHRGYLYVGMTSKAPAVRVEEHRRGIRSGHRRTYSLTAHRLFVRRRPELEPNRKYFSSEAALQAESDTRLALEAKGFKVIGGTERLPRG